MSLTILTHQKDLNAFSAVNEMLRKQIKSCLMDTKVK